MGQTPLLQDLKKARHLVQDEFWNNNALGLSLYIRKFARERERERGRGREKERPEQGNFSQPFCGFNVNLFIEIPL